ncbi:MAG: TolC family protein [Helicobacteraceae bacterium]|jgi:multidrug efflux system outer membrane protein|nr:TolC family protein [Helicobacteraceae bacterium]
MYKLLSLALILALLAGCSLAPSYETPQLSLPKTDENSTANIDREWFYGFGDRNLNMVVDEALNNNFDLQIASSNVAAARAALGLARAQQFPSVNAGGKRERVFVKNPADDSKFIMTDSYSVSGIVSYELDLWAKYWDSARSASSRLMAMEAAREAARLSVTAGAIEAYFALIMSELNYKNLSAMLENKEESFKLRKKQASVGAVSDLVMSQLSANLNGTRAQLLEADRSRNATRNALAVLLGRSPQEIIEGNVPLSDEFPRETLPAISLPSDLLLRRPDIIAAEEQLKAANYSIGAARAQYLPSITLTGVGGFASSQLSNLFKTQSQMGVGTAEVGVPLLNFGRISSQVDAARAAKEGAIWEYRKAVSKAFGEVNDALIRRELAAVKITELIEQEKSLQTALDLTKRQLNEGYVDAIAVMDAETDLMNAQMALNAGLLENVAAQVELYKSLGGGYVFGEEPKEKDENEER